MEYNSIIKILSFKVFITHIPYMLIAGRRNEKDNRAFSIAVRQNLNEGEVKPIFFL
ncbi:MAG: hypothetical protein SVY15_00720 [Halobacteriota archaeon]|nr:hypothetical protein [Halobacteriota archaeon]